ncbi:MAG: FHA domain-containing protein [Myxococcales bacterium]|nr:FHA domain-containing protein [Myxococcales bacterium]
MGARLCVRSAWTARRDTEPLIYELDQARISVGRSAGADVRLPHPAVSALHASLRADGLGYSLIDEGSTNGTRLNGRPLVPGRRSPLRSGDRIEIGGFVLDVEVGVAVSAATSDGRTASFARRMLRAIYDDASPLEPPSLSVTAGPDLGLRVTLDAVPSVVSIGRDRTSTLTLTDGDVSRQHARVERDLDGVVLHDVGSKNGVEVNGKRCDKRHLRDRDEVRLGQTVLVFEDPAEAALRACADEEDREMALPSLERLDDAPEPEALPPLETSAAGDLEAAPSRRAPPLGATTRSGPPGAGWSQPEHRVVPDAPRRRHLTDLLIYGVAALILAASVAGLVYVLYTP